MTAPLTVSARLVGPTPGAERRSWHRLYLWADSTGGRRVAAYAEWEPHFPDGPPTGKGAPLYVGPERRVLAGGEVLR